MEANATLARFCGALYLIVVATGLFALMYVPGQIIVAGDNAATAANILAQQALYRAGIAALLLNQLAFFCLPLALYRLLSPVNEPIARVMVLAALLAIPFGLMSAAERMVILDLLTGDHGLSQAALMQDLALSRASASRAMMFAWTFWGLWLLPFGWLVFRSGFLPRLLGIALMAGCAGYLVSLFGHILVPDFAAMGIGSVARLPATVGEIGICLWLLLMGARPRRAAPLTPPPPGG